MFGSPGTVTANTSPPDASNAINWTCHNGKPVSRSVFGWPVSNAKRCSGDRVHTNETPAVSIRSFIAFAFLFVNVFVPTVAAVRPQHRKPWTVHKGRHVTWGSSRDVTSPPSGSQR